MKISKHNLHVLAQRRDYLMEKIADKRIKNMPLGYEESEVKALNNVIVLATGYISSEKTDNEVEGAPDKIPRTEDFAPGKAHQIERTVLKELIRSSKSKLIMTKEHRSEREYISFQNFNLNEKDGQWKAGQKTSIYLTEIQEVISVLRNEEIISCSDE